MKPNFMRTGKILKLGAVASVSFILYFLLTLQYPLGPSLDGPRATWASMVAPTWLNAAYHLLIYMGLTLLYMVVLR